MIKKTYSDKLKDPRWQKKRLSILERDEWTCQSCYNDQITLHVHHKKYSGSNPWECDDEDLITLCEVCHDQETEDSKTVSKKMHGFLNEIGFLSKDILWEIDKVEKIHLVHDQGVVISAWFNMLQDVTLQKKMVDDFFESQRIERLLDSPNDF